MGCGVRFGPLGASKDCRGSESSTLAVETDWIERLSGESSARDAALADLRELLRAKLRHAFASSGDDFIEDITQDALLKIHSQLDAFEGRSKFTTWALTIAVRVGYTELRRMRWKDVSLEQVTENSASVDAGRVDSQNEPAASAARKQLVEAVHTIIDENLTQKQRDVLQAELAGMPQEEIGRRLGMNRNAIYKLTYDARKKLKKELERRGFSQEDLSTD